MARVDHPHLPPIPQYLLSTHVAQVVTWPQRPVLGVINDSSPTPVPQHRTTNPSRHCSERSRHRPGWLRVVVVVNLLFAVIVTQQCNFSPFCINNHRESPLPTYTLHMKTRYRRRQFKSASTSRVQAPLACKSSFNFGPDEQWGVSQRVFGEGHWGMTWIVCFGYWLHEGFTVPVLSPNTPYNVIYMQLLQSQIHLTAYDLSPAWIHHTRFWNCNTGYGLYGV
ncbi:hypothetical protein WG66_011120 [Moniliophthora roreri]|nr:hypothetical protein WG66_011120 [Moniliophthora roreri]